MLCWLPMECGKPFDGIDGQLMKHEPTTKAPVPCSGYLEVNNASNLKKKPKKTIEIWPQGETIYVQALYSQQ